MMFKGVDQATIAALHAHARTHTPTYHCYLLNVVEKYAPLPVLDSLLGTGSWGLAKISKTHINIQKC